MTSLRQGIGVLGCCPMSTEKRPVALFDFDGTLTRKDTTAPFFGYLLKRYPAALVELPKIAAWLPAYGLGLISKERMKTIALSIVTHVPDAELAGVIQWFHDAEILPTYFRDALERVAWHRSQGHRLVLVSASLELYLQPAKRQLGFDQLIGTRANLDKNPHVLGNNCFGSEKVKRLMEQDWFDQTDWPDSWAYSDHHSDLPLLMLAGHPVATTPTKALRTHAIREGWTIIDYR